MPPTHVRRRLAMLALALCAVLAGALGPSGPASAHNTLVSSDPADGAQLSTAPPQITWVFDRTVPLETMTVTLIDATGVRSELVGSVHGNAGDTEVVTPMPALQAGPVSVRWRLVGPDGHAITGRVDFAIAPFAPPPDAVDATTPPSPAVTAPASTPTAVDVPSPDQDDDASSTPSIIRWILRYVAYLAIMSVVGVLLTTAHVWSGLDRDPIVRRLLGCSLAVTAALGILQLLVLSSDVSGRAPWSSWGSIDAAATTGAGLALAIRVVLASTMWVVLFRYRSIQSDIYWTAVTLPGLGLLATWAFAGHARSMRWPTVGVATDVAHHAAAAAWLAGLAVVGWIVIPRAPAEVLAAVVRRFSRVAAISVAVLVATGLVQTLRLVGGPMDLFDAEHGRYLAAKLVVLAAMLGVANANRRRIAHDLDENITDASRLDRTLRRGIVAEFAIGLLIVAITASMVVSPPSSGRTETRAHHGARTAFILHDVVLTERPSS